MKRCVLATILFVTMPVMSDPVVKIKTNYYEVKGSSTKLIRKSLDKNMPVFKDGNRYDAYTEWYVKWNYRTYKTSGKCKIESVSTSVDIQYMMPKLLRNRKTSSTAIKKWNRYYAALEKHEEGHGDFGIRAAKEIEKNISLLTSMKNCQQLSKKANQLGHKILKKYIRDEKRYDKETKHGIKTGVVFP